MRLLIRDYCTRHGISQSKLSRLSDVSLKGIRAAWNDPYHNIELHTLEKIAHALEVRVCDLIEEDEVTSLPQ